jgi:hypothetical protein
MPPIAYLLRHSSDKSFLIICKNDEVKIDIVGAKISNFKERRKE